MMRKSGIRFSEQIMLKQVLPIRNRYAVARREVCRRTN
jgi:hypothetical protein